jgi:hypothetical protein
MDATRIVDAIPITESSLLGVVEVQGAEPRFAVAAFAGEAIQLGGDVPFEPAGLCRHADRVVLVGREGEVALIHGSSSSNSARISPRPTDGPFRQVVSNGRELFALASDRQVFKAVAVVGPWVAMGMPADLAAMVDESEDIEAAFGKLLADSKVWMALHASAGAELVAVGTAGDARAWDGTRWNDLSLPTNANLYAVTRVSSGDVVIGGLGAIWVCASQRCEARCEGEIDGDVLSVVEHAQSLWLVTTTGVFKVDRNWRVAEVNLPERTSRPFRLLVDGASLHLLCDHDVLRGQADGGFEKRWSGGA